MPNPSVFAPPVSVSRRDLKRAAREDLRAARPSAWKVTLVYLLLTTGLALLLNLILGRSVPYTRDLLVALLTYDDPQQIMAVLSAPSTPVAVPVFFLQILLQLYTVVLSFGYYSYTLRRTRGQDASFGNLLSGFGMAGRVIVMNLIILGFSLCWSMLVMAPVTLAVTFLLTLFFAGAAAGGSEVLMSTYVLMAYPVVILVFVAAALVLVFLLLRYAFAPFCLADQPDAGPLEAVRRSRALLAGRGGELFKLVLSFVGWSLLDSLLSGLVYGGCIALGCFLFLGTGSLTALTACLVAGQVLSILLPLPLTLWLTGYYTGALARYYCALSAGEPQPAHQGQLPGEAGRPL